MPEFEKHKIFFTLSSLQLALLNDILCNTDIHPLKIRHVRPNYCSLEYFIESAELNLNKELFVIMATCMGRELCFDIIYHHRSAYSQFYELLVFCVYV